MIKVEESVLADQIKLGDRSAFSIAFTQYYADLVIFAYNFLKDKDSSEEVVQDVFIKLWENRDKITISVSLKSFLLKSIKNRCIDRLRHLKIRSKYQEMILDHPVLFDNDTDNYMLYSELEKKLESALNRLPEEVAATFTLSRFEGFTYNEIADKLNISVRTVEVRVSKALGMLRGHLKDYLIIFLALYLLII